MLGVCIFHICDVLTLSMGCQKVTGMILVCEHSAAHSWQSEYKSHLRATLPVKRTPPSCDSFVQVINLYMVLLKERESRADFQEEGPHPVCHFFNSFFYNKVGALGKRSEMRKCLLSRSHTGSEHWKPRADQGRLLACVYSMKHSHGAPAVWSCGFGFCMCVCRGAIYPLLEWGSEESDWQFIIPVCVVSLQRLERHLGLLTSASSQSPLSQSRAGQWCKTHSL